MCLIQHSDDCPAALCYEEPFSLSQKDHLVFLLADL